MRNGKSFASFTFSKTTFLGISIFFPVFGSKTYFLKSPPSLSTILACKDSRYSNVLSLSDTIVFLAFLVTPSASSAQFCQANASLSSGKSFLTRCAAKLSMLLKSDVPLSILATSTTKSSSASNVYSVAQPFE